MSNALPDDGVIAPKHVGAVLMSILMQILKLFLRQFTVHLLVNKKTLIINSHIYYSMFIRYDIFVLPFYCFNILYF
jgi:predicted membrane-bound mannosyltransferase